MIDYMFNYNLMFYQIETWSYIPEVKQIQSQSKRSTGCFPREKIPIFQNSHLYMNLLLCNGRPRGWRNNKTKAVYHRV